MPVIGWSKKLTRKGWSKKALIELVNQAQEWTKVAENKLITSGQKTKYKPIITWQTYKTQT